MLDFYKQCANMLNRHIQRIDLFYKQSKDMSLKYQISKEKYKPLGFNVFSLVSHRYYFENFHSDIIKAFLEPSEKHGEGFLFLRLFLEILKVDWQNYTDAKVTREENRIDILIKSKLNKRAIIIENKLNNAPDTYNQIPSYYDSLKSGGYAIDKIVYIPLDNAKIPDRTTWESDNLSEIDACLQVMPAVSNALHEVSLTQWIEKCIISSNIMDNISILRQYCKLVKFLRGEIMDNVILEKFHSNLLDGENLSTAISIKNMLNDLPAYLAFKINNKYKTNCNPFAKIFIYQTRDVVFEGYKNFGNSFKLDIWCSVEGFEVYFWEQTSNENCFVKDMFSTIQSLNDFTLDKGLNYSITKTFPLHGETELYNFIDTLLGELQKMKS